MWFSPSLHPHFHTIFCTSAVLENKDYYGLKRSEIGEAASKIGRKAHILL